MLSNRVKAVSPLAAAAVFVAVLTGGGQALAAVRAALPSGHDLAGSVQELDRMGGSGSAGMDPARARAVTAAAEAGLTGDITFSVPSGTFQTSVSVQLSTAVEGAQIRYTTDGKVPTASSTLYSSALNLTATTQVRAQAFVNGAATGTMGTAMYVARAVNATGDLPMVVMDDYGAGKPTKTGAKDVSFMVMAPSGGSTSLAATPAIATRASFHVRGQSSANFEKAPYKVELRDNQDKDVDYPVLGMAADSDWALLGPFPDKTLIHDAFAWDVAREMGLLAPHYAFVELYLNLDKSPLASTDYQGVYLLAETIKRGNDRVPVAKLKNTDTTEPAVTGGYIMQFNVAVPDAGPQITCTRRNQQDPCWGGLEIVYPKQEDLQAAQKTWITGYVQKFHDALHGSNPSNPQTGYPAYIDVDSWVNRIIHNELAHEADEYIRSTHFYKDRGGKLVAGPVWDYDLGYNGLAGMGFGFGGANSAVQGWQYQQSAQMGGFGGGMSASDWFVKLMADPTFLTAIKNRWKTLRQGVLSDARMTARVNALSTQLTNASKRNFQRWNNLNTSYVGGFQTQTTQTWEQQLQIMRDFLTQRAAWMDQGANWGGGVVVSPSSSRPGSPSSSRPGGPSSSRPGQSSSAGQGGRSCTASYKSTNTWGGGFQGEITVKAGNAAISGWRVTWTLAGGQQLTQVWNAKLSTSGSSVTVTNEAYNGSLAAGASTTFGLTGTGSGGDPSPACTAS